MKICGTDMNITNERITAYIDKLYTNSNPGLQELRRFAEEKRVPIILRDTEGLLLRLLEIKKPEYMLEIGAAVGYSACCFADGCDCNVATIEADLDAYKTARINISALGFSDKIKVIYGDAREVLEKMNEENDSEEGLFDAVFIDAAKSHYKAFWDLVMPLCKQDALVICDNVLMKGMTASDEYDPNRKYKTSIRKMREFIKYINDLEYANTCVLPVGDGVSISVIDREKLVK